MIALSVVFPCYNEGQTLPWLIPRFLQAIPEGLSVELIVVNNGSSDDSAAILESFASREPYRSVLRIVTVPSNRGYGDGIWRGLRAARGEFLAWSHADTQYDPAIVFGAFERLRAEPSPQRTVMKGRRQRRSLFEAWTTVGMGIAARALLRQPLSDINAQPKVFHHSLMGALTDPPHDLSFDLYVLYRALRSGWRISTMDVVFGARRHGRSSWAFSLPSRARHIMAAIRYMRRLARSE